MLDMDSVAGVLVRRGREAHFGAGERTGVGSPPAGELLEDVSQLVSPCTGQIHPRVEPWSFLYGLTETRSVLSDSPARVVG
ncbi:hypothetical protein GCM10010214_12970 [Streptomyces abikoensis]|nr:hypothetical protein GCM10010214_12970 [Streptomyces abikoensis]